MSDNQGDSEIDFYAGLIVALVIACFAILLVTRVL